VSREKSHLIARRFRRSLKWKMEKEPESGKTLRKTVSELAPDDIENAVKTKGPDDAEVWGVMADIPDKLRSTEDIEAVFDIPAQVSSKGQPESGAPIGAPVAHEVLENLRILFVEDDEEDGQIIVGHLKELGIKTILWVHSAVHALFQLREDKALFPNILITELVLAGTNGIQLIAKLRAENDLSIRKLPVITITSTDSPSIYRRATKYDISAYLKKPVSTHALGTALLRAIEGKTIEPPLEFGRSWIDEAEDAEDADSEGTDQIVPPPSFANWLLNTLLDVVWPRRRRARKRVT
jgi:CheY-like chemotaxis protein